MTLKLSYNTLDVLYTITYLDQMLEKSSFSCGSLKFREDSCFQTSESEICFCDEDFCNDPSKHGLGPPPPRKSQSGDVTKFNFVLFFHVVVAMAFAFFVVDNKFAF